MHLVEVVRSKTSNDETIATLVDLVRKLGKVPVVVADSPGFLVNRILFPYLDEAVRMVIEGVAGEEIDRDAVRFGMPMGPLELLDQIGLDIAADVAKTFAALTRDPGPSPARVRGDGRRWCAGQEDRTRVLRVPRRPPRQADAVGISRSHASRLERRCRRA